MAPDPLFQLGGVGLNPAKLGGVIDQDPSVRQHRREITIADWESQIPA